MAPLSENYLSLPWIYRPTIVLPEHILKVVNICDMHWIGGIKVLVKCTLRVISAIVEIVRKSALTLLLDNIMAPKAQVMPKIIDITLLYQNLFIGNLLRCLDIKWAKSISLLWVKNFDDFTVTLSLCYHNFFW